MLDDRVARAQRFGPPEIPSHSSMSHPSSPSSSARLRVAVVGCGRPLRTAGATGYGMAHRHMAGYRAYGRCDLVAVADLSAENAAAFVAEHGPAAQIFDDAAKMAAAVRPDVVSVCLWPHLHAQVVEALAPHRPRAIFCEKPMDIHWDACVRMHETCRAHGVRLAINHQRRFNRPLLRARELLKDNAIGPLRRMEGAWNNLFDSGTHALDLMFHFNDDTPATWVLGQIDGRGARRVFGALHAGHGVTDFRFANGVRGLYRFGLDYEDNGGLLRLVGERGEILVRFSAPWLRLRRDGADWEDIDTGETIHEDAAIYRGIADVLDSLGTDRVPWLASDNAIRSTEVIFATHESARRRARVDLPLAPGPCAFLTMIERGELVLEPEAK